MANMKNKLMKLPEILSTIIYAVLSSALIVISIGMVAHSVYDIWIALHQQADVKKALLDAIGFLVISMAVFDVAKYLLEEEVFRERELRSPREARETLTKFLVIISIAVSLEALVFTFDAGKDDITLLVYPALLMMASVMLVVGLGIYQKLSVQTEKSKDIKL